ncbi:MAG: hypothetical protein ACK4S4_15630 [Pyrinomonadaceae bacterium]
MRSPQLIHTLAESDIDSREPIELVVELDPKGLAVRIPKAGQSVVIDVNDGVIQACFADDYDNIYNIVVFGEYATGKD